MGGFNVDSREAYISADQFDELRLRHGNAFEDNGADEQVDFSDMVSAFQRGVSLDDLQEVLHAVAKINPDGFERMQSELSGKLQFEGLNWDSRTFSHDTPTFFITEMLPEATLSTNPDGVSVDLGNVYLRYGSHFFIQEGETLTPSALVNHLQTDDANRVWDVADALYGIYSHDAGLAAFFVAELASAGLISDVEDLFNFSAGQAPTQENVFRKVARDEQKAALQLALSSAETVLQQGAYTHAYLISDAYKALDTVSRVSQAYPDLIDDEQWQTYENLSDFMISVEVEMAERVVSGQELPQGSPIRSHFGRALEWYDEFFGAESADHEVQEQKVEMASLVLSAQAILNKKTVNNRNYVQYIQKFERLFETANEQASIETEVTRGLYHQMQYGYLEWFFVHRMVQDRSVTSEEVCVAQSALTSLREAGLYGDEIEVGSDFASGIFDETCSE